MSNFKTDVWNQIEALFLNEYFLGTEKGVIKEVEEYSNMLLRGYQKILNKLTQTEYIRKCLKRDCMVK